MFTTEYKEFKNENDKVGWLLWMAVEDKYQGMKLGTKLLKEAIKIMRSKGVKHIYGYTRTDNTPIYNILERERFMAEEIYFSYILKENWDTWLEAINKRFPWKSNSVRIINYNENGASLRRILENSHLFLFPNEEPLDGLFSVSYLTKFINILETGNFILSLKGKTVGFYSIQTFWKHKEYGKNAWLMWSLFLNRGIARRSIANVLKRSLNYADAKGAECFSFVTKKHAWKDFSMLPKIGFEHFPVYLWRYVCG